eukprot:CAMPEP_0185745062 /NCGR_PEP_ID=MMETSP1174-20130828/3361_1 /TAXON_ID=35687 /ORGANISM="Dictyocha speculum, Strain CCMP1381" /LENGTH=50 /DNA_ID=CAMNT_0028418853 /DNA_START=393 /DNA_END=545 /DNA_ORIENTATION=-
MSVLPSDSPGVSQSQGHQFESSVYQYVRQPDYQINTLPTAVVAMEALDAT